MTALMTKTNTPTKRTLEMGEKLDRHVEDYCKLIVGLEEMHVMYEKNDSEDGYEKFLSTRNDFFEVYPDEVVAEEFVTTICHFLGVGILPMSRLQFDLFGTFVLLDMQISVSSRFKYMELVPELGPFIPTETIFEDYEREYAKGNRAFVTVSGKRLPIGIH